MPNVASVLREEISRLARKEIRQEVGPLKKTNTELRRTVSALKGEVTALQRKVRFLEKQEKRRLESTPTESTAKVVRFSPKWVKADRQRLGLSAKDYGSLVGVSSLTIYNWESGKSKPMAERLAAWAEVRGIGKREALRRLELLLS
ncbi:MAG: helix-turn-helix domain-containing protein [Thermoanaerobaculales bacterium]